MNKKIFIKKVFLPTTVLFICFVMFSFFKNGTFVDKIHPYILLYLLILCANVIVNDKIKKFSSMIIIKN